MKNYLIIGAVWVVGLLMGSWWNQSELTLSKVEIARLNRELNSKTRRSLIPDMTRMMAVPEPRQPRSRPAEPDGEAHSSRIAVAIPTPDSAPDAKEVSSSRDEFAIKMSEAMERTESPEEAFAIMEDLWKTRREIAKASLIDHLGLSPAEIQDFDAAINGMNDDLADTVVGLFDQFQAFDKEPTPEEAFRMANEFTGVFVATYDSMDETLPGNWRDETSEPLDLTAFIDPGIFKPFMEMDRNWNQP